MDRIDLGTYYTGGENAWPNEAFGRDIAIPIVGRKARIEPTNDVVRTKFPILAHWAIVQRLNAGKSPIGLDLPPSYLIRHQIQEGHVL